MPASHRWDSRRDMLETTIEVYRGESAGWQSAAACQHPEFEGTEPQWFPPEDNRPGYRPSRPPDASSWEGAREAVSVCRQQCPVRAQCLGDALEYNEASGIWGGTMPRERFNMRRTLQRTGHVSGMLEVPARKWPVQA